MDKKDLRILFALSINSRETLRNIAKEVGLSKDAVKNRIEKLVTSKVIAKFRAVVDLREFKIQKYDILFRFSNEQELRQVITQLKTDKRVTWLARLFGTYDLRISYIAQNYNELHDLTSKLKTNAEITMCKIEKQAKKDSIELNKMLLDVSSRKQQKISKVKTKYKVDRLDKKILNILINNARTPNNEIARKLKTTQDVIHYRIKKLESSQVITKYTTDLDTSKFGKIWCITLVRIKNLGDETIKKLNNFIATKPVSTYAILTGEWNLSIAFFGNDMQEIYNIFKEIRSELSEVILRVEPLITTERYFKEQKII